MGQKSKRLKTGNKGKQNFQKLQKEVDGLVPKYPLPDFHESVSRKRNTPKGRTIEITAYTAAALLVGVCFYAAIIHDRALLLDLAYIAVTLLTGAALGKSASTWLRDKKRDGTDEEGD